MELKIVEKGEYIAEAFGWQEKTFEKLTEAMKKNFTGKILKAIESKDENDCPSKVSLLQDFLASRDFKNLKLKLATPNDWFVFGYAYNIAQRHIDTVVKKAAIKHILGHVLDL